MCANVLKNSRDVELTGELSANVGHPTLTWLAAVRRERKDSEVEWFYRLCRSTFRSVAKSRPAKRPGVRWFGHKTPRHEQHFDIYESLFDHAEARARYVYCLRNPFHVWRSYRAIPWSGVRDVRVFLDAWIASVDAFEAMRTAAPDRVFLFNLDDMLAAPDRLSWFRVAMLDALEIRSDSFRKPVEALENSNSTEAKFGAAPPEAPPADLRRIARDRRVRRIMAAYFPELENIAS